jgi:hypothetical protein
MSTSTAIASGHIEFTPRPAAPVPQTGGRRPPSDRNTSNRLRRYPPVRLLTADSRVIQWSNGTTWRKD